jgi:excinuclease ABC subunit B
MAKAIDESNRRRQIQLAYNQANNITPASIQKAVDDILASAYEADYVTVPAVAEDEAVYLSVDLLQKKISELHKKMMDAARNLEFEEAARLRDEIKALENRELQLRG